MSLTTSSFLYLGLIIYLFYGYRHSSEAMKPTNVEEGDVTVLPETPEIHRNISTPQLQGATATAAMQDPVIQTDSQ